MFVATFVWPPKPSFFPQTQILGVTDWVDCLCRCTSLRPFNIYALDPEQLSRLWHRGGRTQPGQDWLRCARRLRLQESPGKGWSFCGIAWTDRNKRPQLSSRPRKLSVWSCPGSCSSFLSVPPSDIHPDPVDSHLCLYLASHAHVCPKYTLYLF